VISNRSSRRRFFQILLSALSSHYRRVKNGYSVLSPNLDAVSWPNKLWSLSPDPLSYKRGMLAGFPLRRTQMSVHIPRGHLARQIKEKSLHNLFNRTQIATFVSDISSLGLMSDRWWARVGDLETGGSKPTASWAASSR
jgi:hypothetical protein